MTVTDQRAELGELMAIHEYRAGTCLIRSGVIPLLVPHESDRNLMYVSGNGWLHACKHCGCAYWLSAERRMKNRDENAETLAEFEREERGSLSDSPTAGEEQT